MTTDIPRGALPGTGSLTTLGTGGEGTVYDLPADAVPAQVKEAASGRRVVYKQFRTPDSPAEAEHHRAVVGFLGKLGSEQREWLLDRAAWPLAVVEDAGTVCGILMPRVPDRFFRDFPLSGGRTRRGEAGFQMLLNDGRYLDRMGLPLTGDQKYALLAEVSDLLRVLQGGGVVVGDLSARNLMFCQGAGAAAAYVYLIDCDSVSVPGSDNPDSMETPGWEVPVGEEKQTGDADRYKFGLLVLRLLVGDQQTRDPGRLPEDTAGAVKTLVTETLRDGAGKRPPLGVWNEVLQRPQGKSGQGAVIRDGGSAGSGAGEEVTPTSSVKEESPEGDAPEEGKKSWYRRTGVVVAAVVLLLALVGGVGIYAANTKDDGQDNSSASSSNGEESTATTYMPASEIMDGELNSLPKIFVDALYNCEVEEISGVMVRTSAIKSSRGASCLFYEFTEGEDGKSPLFKGVPEVSSGSAGWFRYVNDPEMVGGIEYDSAMMKLSTSGERYRFSSSGYSGQVALGNNGYIDIIFWDDRRTRAVSGSVSVQGYIPDIEEKIISRLEEVLAEP